MVVTAEFSTGEAGAAAAAGAGAAGTAFGGSATLGLADSAARGLAGSMLRLEAAVAVARAVTALGADGLGAGVVVASVGDVATSSRNTVSGANAAAVSLAACRE